MYDIASGKVGVYANYSSDDEKKLTELFKGQYFGEIGLVGIRPRSATVVALDDVELAVIDSDTFSSYFKENPDKVLSIMQGMGKRICELTDDYLDACRATVEAVNNEKDEKKKDDLMSKFGKFINDYYAIAGHPDIR